MIVIRVDGSHYVSMFNKVGLIALKDKSRAYDFGTMQKAIDFVRRIGSKEFEKVEILKEVA